MRIAATCQRSGPHWTPPRSTAPTHRSAGYPKRSNFSRKASRSWLPVYGNAPQPRLGFFGRQHLLPAIPGGGSRRRTASVQNLSYRRTAVVCPGPRQGDRLGLRPTQLSPSAKARRRHRRGPSALVPATGNGRGSRPGRRHRSRPGRPWMECAGRTSPPATDRIFRIGPARPWNPCWTGKIGHWGGDTSDTRPRMAPKMAVLGPKGPLGPSLNPPKGKKYKVRTHAWLQERT